MPTRQQEDEMVKQRERAARSTSTRVPNLASLVIDSPNRPPVSRYGEPATKQPPAKMTQQEQDLLAKQREREARGVSRSQVVPNLGSKLSPVGRNPKPSVVQKAGFPTPPGIQQQQQRQQQQSPAKMPQEQRDALLKQHELSARRTSSTVHNLAEKLNDTKPSARPTVQSSSGRNPGGSPMSQEQQDALLKQRLKQQDLSSSRRTSSKVQNLAEKLNPTNPPSSLPNGYPMSQEQQDALIKQRLKQQDMSSRRTSSKVQNLADKLNPSNPSSARVAQNTGGSIPGGPPMSQMDSRRTSSKVHNLAQKMSPMNTSRATVQAHGNLPGRPPPFSQQQSNYTTTSRIKSRDEEDAQIKRREMSARSGMTSSIAPGLSRRVTDSVVVSTNQSKSARDEEDAFAKQSELEARRAVSGPLPTSYSRTTTTTPAPTRPQERAQTSSSLQARYHAAGLALGIEDGADLMMQGDIYGSHHNENVVEANTQEYEPVQLDSEDAIRERYRAAAVAMGGGTQEDEDMQIKAREKEAARLRPPAPPGTTIGHTGRVGSSTEAMQSSASASIPAHADDMSFSSEDAQAKLQAQRPTQSAMIGDMRSSMSNEDARAKSRGRMERPPSVVRNIVHGDVVAGEADPAAAAQQGIVPGAFACNMGEREHLSKPVLPAHPEFEPTPDNNDDDNDDDDDENGEGTVQELQSMISRNDIAPPVTDARGTARLTEIPGDADEEATRDTIPYGETRQTGVETFREDPAEEEKIAPKKRTWIWIVVAVLIVAIGGGVAGALAAGGSSSETDSPGIATTDAPTEAPTVVDPPDVIAARSILSGVSSASSFADRSSPQSRALSWIASEDKKSEIPEDGIGSNPNFLTRYVLAVFYYSLGGENWLGSSGWLDDTDECGWEHISCNLDGVIESIIDDAGNNFAGTIPNEIQYLDSLASLQLKNNRVVAIAGPLGTKLRSLDLENNDLKGSFPEGIYKMTSLTSLILDNNNLSGTITTEIGNLKALVYLSLQENEFNGFLTDEFKSLTKLEELLLGDNSFRGEVNFLLDGLPALKHIRLSQNSFTGSIRPGLEKLTGLERFEVGSNQLAGPLPMFLANATGLLGLDLSDNDFVGSIGTEIGQLTGLQRLKLQRCSLTGSIPTEIGNLNRLLDLQVEINKLENGIPSEIGSLSGLRIFSMQQNFIIGTIPTDIGGLGKLRTLLLDTNELTGTVPTEFANLSDLDELRLGSNFQMSGSIPSEVCALPNLRLINVVPSGIFCDCGSVCM